MKIKFNKQNGSKYLIMYLSAIWKKIGKDKSGNWFCAIGDNSGTKKAYHSSNIFKVIKKMLQLKYDPA